MEKVNSSDASLYLQSNKIAFFIANICIFILVPLVIKNLLQGHTYLGLSLLVFVSILIIDTLAEYKGQKLPIPINIVLIAMTVSIVTAIYEMGVYGVFWTYPAVVSVYFVRSQKMANIFGFILLACASWLSWVYVEPQVAIRVFFSLGLTMVIINIIVGEITNLEAQLLDQNIRDPLTEIFNRRYMDICLNDTLEQYSRTKRNSSIIIIDIDHFKLINDQFGHGEGDAVLKAVVAVIRKNTRKTDLLFRMGGEEFVLLIRDASQLEAMKHAEELRKAVASAQILPSCAVTISIGGCAITGFLSVSHWLEQADIALYQAKRSGRNSISWADSEHA